MVYIRFIYLFLGLFCLNFTFSQSIGDWILHSNLSKINELCLGSNKVLAATNNSLILYDFNENSYQKLSNAEQLSDFEISTIGYDAASNTFIIAYANSNIDLLKDNTIINISDLKNKQITGSKYINNIYTYNSKSYLSTDFSLIELDLKKELVLNTFIIGSNGNSTPVYDCTIYKDTLFVVTEEGLKKGPLDERNLLDYSQWEHINTPSLNIHEIELYNGDIYALSNGLYKYSNGNWLLIYIDNSATLSNLTTSSTLTFISDYKILQYQNNQLDTVSISNSSYPSCYINEGTNNFTSDLAFGLFHNGNSVDLGTSPFSDKGFKSTSYNNYIAISSGVLNANVDGVGNGEKGFYIYSNGSWQNINIYNALNGLPKTEDYNYLTYNSFNNSLYVANLKGLIEYNFNTAIVYNPSNSLIKPSIGDTGHYKITGVDVDSKGNVWMINPQATHALLAKSLDNTWHEFIVGDDNFKYRTLLVDRNDQKWFGLRNEGLFVFKEGDNLSQTNSVKIRLTQNVNNGNLPNNNVNCIAEDKDGQIWVGTDEGIAVFSCPENIFDANSDCKNSGRITSTLDQYTEYLFETDAVYAIAIDGANRKWIGTSSGAWLMSENGQNVIEYFNEENSPIPNKEVLDISINKESGEVFFITNNGMASYIGDATESFDDFNNIKAYPNPVRPDFKENISITGLTENAYVKITDSHGNLINEGYALGGKYIWNGNDYNGTRAKTGVYYVFSNNFDASERIVTKIAFIN